MAARHRTKGSNTPIRRLSVVGLGKLGLTLASVLADSGYQVDGIELDGSKVDAVNKGKSPLYEPGLGELIKKNKERISASTSFEAIASTDATFVVVPTPSEPNGEFSTKLVKAAMESVGKELAAKQGYHLVVLTSTVGPGSMDSVIKPALEKASQKRVGADFGLCYNPEFIALGDVIKGLREPDFILIGESDKDAGDMLTSIQRTVCTNDPPIERMEFVNAELAKIAVNSFVTMKMSFANTLAQVAEGLENGNVDKVTAALGRDKRIGPAYLKGAIGYGGPCFVRDNVAFAFYADRVGAQARIPEATHEVNKGQVDRLIRLLKKRGLKKGSKVAVLGLSYKPNTNVVEQSQSLQLAKALESDGYTVRAFDPAAMESAASVLSADSLTSSAEEAVRGSDVVILATAWPEFRKLKPELFKGKQVFDCWRFFGDDVRSVSRYSSIGVA
jgi:UDPglucose 6-dehydrogenase